MLESFEKLFTHLWRGTLAPEHDQFLPVNSCKCGVRFLVKLDERGEMDGCPGFGVLKCDVPCNENTLS